MDRIYSIEIDSDLDTKIKEFQKQLNESEQIVNTIVAGNKLIITVRESKINSRNLLLEDIKKGVMPNVFGTQIK